MPLSPLSTPPRQNFHHRSSSNPQQPSPSQNDAENAVNASNEYQRHRGAYDARNAPSGTSLLSNTNILSGGVVMSNSSGSPQVSAAADSYHSHSHSSSADSFPKQFQKTTNSALRAVDRLAAYERCLLIFTIMLGFLILQIILFSYYQRKTVDNQMVLHNGEIIHTLDASWDHYWNEEHGKSQEELDSAHLERTVFDFPHYYSGFQIDGADYAYIVNEVIVKPLLQKLRDYDHVVEFGSGAGGVLCVMNQMLMRESMPSQCVYPLTKIEGQSRQVTGLHFYGIDFSAKMIGRARNYLPHVDFFRSDILTVDFLLDESADHSIAFSVMHYLSSTQEIIEAIKNMIRVTKTGGIIIIGELFECDKIPSLTAEDLRHILPELPNQFDHLLPSAVCIADLEEFIKPLVSEFLIVDTSANARLAQLHPRAKYSFSLRLQK